VNAAVFVFHASLNDLLAPGQRGQAIPLRFAEHQSVKHLIESLGVPHVEVGEILVAGAPVGMEYRPQDGDRIEVHPQLPACPDDPRFLLDNHLGRLAAYLRMLGFDCLYPSGVDDAQIAAMLSEDERILLTRDRRLLMRKAIQRGYCLRSLIPEEQLHELVARYQLKRLVRPFGRCMDCNGLLEPVSKAQILDRLEPLTKEYFEDFSRCPDCDKVYWKGSHHQRMEKLITRVM